MRKIIILFVAAFFFLFSNTVKASDIEQSFQAQYELSLSGETKILYEIELKNLTTEKYISKYELSLQGLRPENLEIVDSEGEVKTTTDSNKLIINFNNQLVGKDKVRKLSIKFTDPNLLIKSGEVWEIYLPSIQNINEFQNYSIQIMVPPDFGQLAYISPNTYSKDTNNTHDIYSFKKQDLGNSAITAAFGKFQVFSFSLTYHLENPVNKTAFIPIALPPDTAFQKMIYTSVEPKPQNLKQDQDGNWIAEFELKAQEKFDITTSGYTQIFSEPYKKQILDQVQEQEYLQPQQYWEVENPKIQSIASNLKTPRQIYDFVVDTLSYDYERIDPRVKRMGAAKALSFPDQAICMEFTDLFITLARAAGIPAREINGFADTNNQQLQPLSLVADVLHSWPEYWDEKRQVWVPVDPTWADTTDGIDFFSKPDLKHFAFVIHGSSSTEPYPAGSYKLGAYPQKDVYISLSHLPENRRPNLTLNINRKKTLSFTKLFFDVELQNNGPVAIYDKSLNIYTDDQKFQEFKVAVLLPFEQISFGFALESGFLAANAPNIVSAQIDLAKSQFAINKDQIVLRSVTLIFFTIFSVTATLYWRLRRR